MQGPRLRRLGTIWALLILSSMVASCTAPEQAASRDELSAARDGKVAAVLIRFVETNQNGQPVKPFPSSHPAWTGGLMLSLGAFETGGKPTLWIRPGLTSEVRGARVQSELPYSARLLSEQSRDEGWMALFLPPGYYYLAVGFPSEGEAQAITGEHRYGFYPGDPVWRVEVAAGKPVLYAGTFHIVIRVGFTGAETGLYPQDTRVDDESQLAKEFAAHELASLPPPVTRLAVRHSGPYLLGVPTAAAK